MKGIILFTICVCNFLVSSAQTPIGTPASIFKIEHNGNANRAAEYVWLINTATKKKTKIVLPAPSYINETPRFENEYIIKIPYVQYSWDFLKTGQPFFLLAVTEDGGQFLKQSGNDDYVFTWTKVSGSGCFVSANGTVFDQRGNRLDAYFIDEYKNCTGVRMNGNKPQMIKYYYNDCRPMALTTSVTDVIDFGEHLVYAEDGMLTVYNVKEDKPVVKAQSVPAHFIAGLYKVGFQPSFIKAMSLSKLMPVQIRPNEWAFLNDQGALVIKPFQADLALPFLFYGKLAPVHFKNKWGLMSKTGEMMYPYQFDSLVIGNNASNTIFMKGDSALSILESGLIVAAKTTSSSKTTSNSKTMEPQKSYGSACLIYIYENPDNGKRAFILVSLGFDVKNIDHKKMSAWTKNAIQSEQSSMWERGYRRISNTFGNLYDADYVYEGRSCYSLRSEYDQSSTWVTVFEKTFE